MERDEFGRFAKGNTIAKGNKGNKRPKWHNSNAIRTGMYDRQSGLDYDKEELYIIYKNESVAIIDDRYYKIVDKSIYVTEEMVKTLKSRFYFPDKWFITKEEQAGYRLFTNYYMFNRMNISIFLHYFALRTVITPDTHLTMRELTNRRFNNLYNARK